MAVLHLIAALVAWPAKAEMEEEGALQPEH